MRNRRDFYRVATEKELERMTTLQKLWYEQGIVPIFLLPGDIIRGQSMNGAFGGCRNAVARLVTQEWLDNHKEWLDKE